MRKKAIIALVVLMLLSVSMAYAGSQIGIVVNGVPVEFTDASPFIDENNRTLVPLRAVGEAMGLYVEWDSVQQKAIFSKEYTWENSPMYRDLDGDGKNDAYLGLERVSFKIGDKIALYDDTWYDRNDLLKSDAPVMGGVGEIKMDTAAIIKDSRTYAPIRYLAEAVRYDVGWANKTVTLNQLYPIKELGITVDMVACWQDYQSWLLIANKESNVKQIDILGVYVNGESPKYYALTDEQKTELDDVGNDFGNFLNGFTVEKELKNDHNYTYNAKILVTMKDGSQKFGYVDINMFFDGGQGGYL